MEFFEKKISHLIDQQFPSFYQTEGPLFIEFVKKYYEWMESANNTLYHSRRILDYKDVDTTVDSFITYFKDKYLHGIQFTTATNTKQFIKHSLDLYRSKGTERSIDLFFKLVYGKPAEVYYPGDDVFKASAGEWIIPKYLEVELTKNIKQFVGKQITGVNSGATAFVEKYIRKKVNGKYLEIFYISALNGTFEKFEQIKNSSGLIGPMILGSLNQLTVATGGSGYKKGQIVNLYSNNGIGGKARVANTANIAGVVSFTLNDGGWGYTSNTKLLISDKVLNVSNTVIDSSLNINTGAFNQFETLYQPLLTINYANAETSFAVGDTLYRFEASSVIGSAQVVSVSNVVSNTGTLLLAVSNGNFDLTYNVLAENSDELTIENGIQLNFNGYNIQNSFGANTLFYKTDDPVSNPNLSAKIVTVTDSSAYANVIKNSANLIITVSNSTNRFTNSELIYQLDGSNVISQGLISSISYTGTTGIARIINANGTFRSNTMLYSNNSSANGLVENITCSVGVIGVNGTFVSNTYNLVYGLESNTVGTISKVSLGSFANASISNTFLYDETVNLNTDILKDYLNVNLNDVAYGFPAYPAGNSSTSFETLLTFEAIEMGSIYNVITTNPGSNYDTAPMIVVYDNLGLSLYKRDIILEVDNMNGSFFIGEIVTHDGQNVGIIKNITNNTISLKRISNIDINAIFVTQDLNELNTEDTNNLINEMTIYGVDSGVIANVINVYEDYSAPMIGINGDISANTIISSGYVTKLDVINSGYGYYDEELVTFKSANNDSEGIASVALSKHGTAEGYYIDNDSALSSDKKLHDGYYYQEYSYVIRSPVTLDKYASMLKNILHVAGTKYFAEYVFPDKDALNTNIQSATIEIE